MNEDVSAVICIYKPDASRLNKCIEHVINQVGEIVVVVDQAGVIPKLAVCHQKVRYVWMPARDVGYGRKANHGAKHTYGKYLWFLNDDVFVAPDCGEKLLQVLRTNDEIGMVGHELRYPDGTLQHGGTFRPAGGFAFCHLDSHQRESRIKEPVEMENVTGASVMMRRRAFEEAGEFCKKYYLYLEDQHLCLEMRGEGWKIFYTPHAKAVHLESQSTKETPEMAKHIRHSWKIFQSHWGPYFEKNRNNPGLGVFE